MEKGKDVIAPLKRIAGHFQNAPPHKEPAPDILVRWRTELTAAQGCLEEIIASSEKGFIGIGERLMDFYKRASGMYDTSRSVVELMTGEEFSGIMQGLSTLLDDLHTMLGDSDRQLQQIVGVLNRYRTILDQTDASLDEFAALVLNLNMLGFLTRVENAHLAGTNSGFASLTDDVRKLAESIKTKSQDIRTTAATVQTSVKAALTGIQTFEKARGAQARAMLDETVAQHRILSGRYAAAAKAAERIAGMTNTIAESTGRIIESLQVHDISRQQMEHVVQIITTVGAQIDSPRLTPADKVLLVRKVSKLQAAQLGQTQAELTGALEQVKSDLMMISRGVGEIAHATRATALTTDDGDVAFADGVSGGIEAVMESLGATSSEEAGLMETVRSTCEQVSLMSGFVREIEELGLHLQLIALNARIKAAHLGKEGAALDAISGNIYALSRDARRDTVGLSDVLAEVARVSGGFEDDLGSAQEHERDTVRALMETMAELKRALARVNDTMQASIGELCREGQTLLGDIDQTVAGITVHIEVQAVLQKVMVMMETIHADAQGVKIDEDASASVEFLADLDQLYTMKSERRVHQMHASEEHPEAEPQSGVVPADDLGDNVELF